ncbi:MAG: sensor histidine kinase [Acidimicrobiia bacterium]
MRTYDFLKEIPYFAELGDRQLKLLCGRTEQVPFEPGETIFEQGSESEEMFVIMQGSIEVAETTGGHDTILAHLGPGEVLGEMSLLEGHPRNAAARAVTSSRVIRVPQEELFRLLTTKEAVLSMLRTVTSRLRSAESILQHDEKMAALGKMAAGLMHELNNPAAALARSSDYLDETLSALQESTRTLLEQGVRLGAPAPDPDQAPTDPLARSDREAEIGDWLEEAEVPEAWDLAPALVAGGWDVEQLGSATEGLDGVGRAAIARWLGLAALSGQLAEEMHMEAERISDLVGTVKRYSYVDQAPVQQLDIQAGLEDTLRILTTKIGPEINVERHYEPDLPKIEGYGGELNQVWTNLIDNALDAMEDGGTLTVKAFSDNGCVVVEVGDTGNGIPEDIQKKIFDPFYTTKPLGEGTGIGLHTVHTIVTKHGGDIRLDSGPGHTEFRVRLPLRMNPAGE